jgi:uncharacterized membrane protein YphA (DoxX/SURF4 family)
MTPVRLAAIVTRVLLGGLFIFASVPKILNPAEFSRTVYYYRLLPAQAVNFIAITLPWVELLVGILLVIGLKVRGAAFVAAGSLVVFTVAMITALARGLNIDCGCFSAAGGHGVDARRIIEDLVLLAAAAFVYWASAQPHRSGLRTTELSELKERP